MQQQQQRVAVGLLGTPGTPCSGQHPSSISFLPQPHFKGDSLAAIVLGEGCSPPRAALNPRGNNAGWYFLKQHGAGGSLVCVPPHQACINASCFLLSEGGNGCRGTSCPGHMRGAHAGQEGYFWSAPPHIRVLFSFYAILYVNP